MLNSEKIKLRYFETKDFDEILKIRSSTEAYEFFFEYEPFNSKQQQTWWEQSYQKNNEKNFIIADNEDNFLGTISLVNIDMRSKKAELGRFFISKENRGNHFGNISITLLLEYAFEHLNMNKIYLEVFAYNKQAIHLYEQIGFESEGLLQKHVFKNGKYCDVAIYAIFPDRLKRN